MDAIILVGGQGLRLRPLTLARHKSLVPVCNRPAIQYLFDWLRSAGMSRVVLAIGQHNEDLAKAFPEGANYGFELLHVVEQERLESGGAIRNAVEEAGIDGRFVVVNGDVYVDFAFDGALTAHRAANADLTLALTPHPDPSSFGVAVVDDANTITKFVEKPSPQDTAGNLVNAGVWIFERGLVDEIPPGPVRVEDTLFPTMVANQRSVLGYQFDGTWADIGTAQRYLDLNLTLLKTAGQNALDEEVVIADEATVQTSALGQATTVEEGAHIRESVVWESCTIGANSRIQDSILADHVVIHDGAVVEGAVIGQGAVVFAGEVVPAGTIIEPGARYHASNGRESG